MRFLIRIDGDRHLLFQSVANLLDNAVKYTPSGGAIDDVSIQPAKEECVLAISDTGPGVPETYREAVRRRFYRLESARTTPGNGLGLALVDAVARMHDARLDLRSNQPGLKCCLIFPAAEPASRRAEYTVTDLAPNATWGLIDASQATNVR